MNEPLEPCTLVLIVVTAVVSYLGFRSREVEEKYIFHPERILSGKEYYRLVTSAFLHANWRHLLLNMLSLYLFGSNIELFVGTGRFLLIYFGAIIGGSLLSLHVHRHQHVFPAFLRSRLALCHWLHTAVVLRNEGTPWRRGTRRAPGW